MKFLTKLGQVITKGMQIVGLFAPTVQLLAPQTSTVVQTVSQDLTEVANVIGDVEAMGQALALPGAQKLQAAQPLVAQIILKSTLLANHKIANPDLFTQGTKKLADGMADVLNSLHADGLQPVNKA